MILVTGGTGFIGRHLLEKLAAAGEPARALVRPAARPRTLPAGIETVYGELVRGNGLDEALRGVDTVIHLAGVTKALAPADYYAGNAAATETLARALSGRPVRLVHVSSLAAIGPGADGAPVMEDAEPHPLTHYGKSKLEAERIVRRLVPDAVIVRPPVVYGPRDTDVFQVLKAVSRGLVIEIAGGEHWFSAIYVEDLAEGLIAAARSPAVGRAWFLAHPKPVSWSGFAAAAATIMGCRPHILRVPVPIAYIAGWCAEVWSKIIRTPGIVSRDKILEAQCACWTCNTSLAAAELGFDAHTPLETGLETTLAWYKKAGWLKY